MRLQLIDEAIALFALAVCFLPVLLFGKRTGKSRSAFRYCRAFGAVVAGGAVNGRDDV